MSYYGTEREIIENLERALAAAVAQRDKAREDALEEAAKICHTIAIRAFIEREAQRNGDFDHCSISEETGRYESAEECEREILKLRYKKPAP